MNLLTKRVVGRSIRDHMKAELVTSALRMTGTHSHLIFRTLDRKLIDPRTVFCGDLGF